MEKPIHVPPQGWPYRGGYDTITECKSCGATGLHQDCHPVKPCYFCGGKVEEVGSAIWKKKFTGKKYFGLIKQYEGYWEKNK